MKAVFIAWTKTERRCVVFNGIDWVDSPTERTHAARGKQFELEEAENMKWTFYGRFGGLDEILVLPLATKEDVREMAAAAGVKGGAKRRPRR